MDDRFHFCMNFVFYMEEQKKKKLIEAKMPMKINSTRGNISL